MTVLAAIVLGIYAYTTLPISLLPNLDIPEITVRINYPGMDARNLENTIIKPLRNQLLQVGGVVNIESSTSDGISELVLSFSYSVSTKLAFIETNEKIDELMSIFPRGMERPMVIKVKPSDIPVFYLSITPTKDYYDAGKSFKELSDFSTSVIKRRLEQLSDISMVDISGLDHKQIEIIPNNEKLALLNLRYSDIITAIKRNNFNIGNLSFRDGYYTYRLKVLPIITTTSHIKNIKININNNQVSLGEIAEIKTTNHPGDGIFIYNGSRAISMAVYKHMDARIEKIGERIDVIIRDIQSANPNIIIEKERDQTQLLSFSMDNLKSTLAIGLFLAIIIVFLIMKNFRLSLIVSVSVPISLIIAFLGLKIAGISINIISLSGLIFSVGLMIDNSIIIIDNIKQHHGIQSDISTAIVMGTNEVIRPLISSMLTTCAVFIPLISLSGLSGALFWDQAITISVSLVVSLLISIMVIPVLYKLLMDHNTTNITHSSHLLIIYERALETVLNHRKVFLLLFFLLIPLGVSLFFLVEKEQFPFIEQNEFNVKINWSEPVTLAENRNRVVAILSSTVSDEDAIYSANIGKSSFQLQKDSRQSINEATIHIELLQKRKKDSLSSGILNYTLTNYPGSKIEILPSKNIFQTIFKPNKESLSLRFRNNTYDVIDHQFIRYIDSLLLDSKLINKANHTSLNELYELEIEPERLLMYGISMDDIITRLKILFGILEVDKLQRSNYSYSISITEEQHNLFNKIQNSTISNIDGRTYPLRNFVRIRKVNRLKSIVCDQSGEFYEVPIDNMKSPDILQSKINNTPMASNAIGVDIVGSILERRVLFNEFLFVLIISLILLYLILAAQFESLLLPIIILLEIVFDITGALLFLYIFNSSLNVMSALGIIVMSGIIINDSIIKIDTINKAYQSSRSLLGAIMEGGKRRFNPIIMTSLTTILALVPFLFFHGLGVELQLPLALSIIGGLLTGTFVSLFFIPVMYFYFVRIREGL